MELNRFRGTGTALVTPFTQDGAIDEARFVAHVEDQIAGGVEFLVPCGTTGEAATLSADEQKRLIGLTVEAAQGRVAVMAGAGGNRTDEVVDRARAARDAGADAILSVSPYYNKPTPSGLYRHYESIANAVALPIFVYNVPGRTGSNIAPETLFRIAEIDNIRGVKEASGDVEQVMTIIADRPAGFLVISGDDTLTLPLIAAGADGLISVVANEAPAMTSDLVRAALAGDLPQARELHYRLIRLMTANFIESNPVPVKAALEMMGRGQAHYRLPLAPLQESNSEALRQALLQAGLI
jgi:4-hydroxy-tetrahydrodipicolinate synthase